MRAIRLFAAAALTGALALMAPVPSMAATPPQVTTAYPGVEVGPGQTTSFPLTVTATGRSFAGLSVTKAPDGWTTLLRGGGFVIDAVYTDPTTPPDVQLDVQVPAEAAEGTYQVAVQGSSAGGTSTGIDDHRIEFDGGKRRADHRLPGAQRGLGTAHAPVRLSH